MIVFLLFILGLCVGSFLNVLIDRLPRDESFVKGRSYCESCKKTLKFFDLIPVFSFIFLKGKCRYCRASLSFYYPLVEIITGMLFVLTYLQIGIRNQESGIMDLLSLFFYLFILCLLIVIFFTDLKYGIIPDKILFPAIILILVYLVIIHDSLFIIHSASGIGAFSFFLLLFLLTRGRGIGFGDVKYAFFMGLFLGFPKIISGFYVAFLTGALVSIILVLKGKKKFKGGVVPFGPFLVFGTIAGFVWGEKLIKILFKI